MIVFPNAKINIGLNIINKREDGFHNIETVFYPLTFHDSLEFLPSSHFSFDCTGNLTDCLPENNLVVKAYQLLSNNFKLPPISIHLHKNIPSGAGLGGGSSDAAWIIRALNDFFNLRINTSDLIVYASKLGSDCAFFVINEPCFASGRGDILEKIPRFENELFILLVMPGIHVSTVDAYSQIVPSKQSVDLKGILLKDIIQWKHNVFNMFETTVFRIQPEISEIKEKLYNSGALYSSMSGSGSSVFGIFNSYPTVPDDLAKYDYWVGKL